MGNEKLERRNEKWEGEGEGERKEKEGERRRGDEKWEMRRHKKNRQSGKTIGFR